MEKRDRFLMEEHIMKCWHVTDDIDTVATAIGNMDMNAADQDVALNMLLGIKAIYHQRFSEMMDLFEELVKNGTIKDVPLSVRDSF